MENETTPAYLSFVKDILSDRRKLLFAGALLAVLISGVGYAVYARVHAVTDPQQAAREEAQKLVAAVSKLMVLPSDEVPIIATVTDPSKLADQPFFAKAKTGDKVLIYNKARKAVLYSPASNRILDVAPLNTGQPSPSPSR